MNDSRVGRIRGLATEAAQVAEGLRDETDPDSAEDRDLTVAVLFLREAIKRIERLEAP